MSQHSFAIANEAGAAFRGDVNNALQALASQSSGASGPGTAYAYQRWADTANSVMKQRNAANSTWLVKESLDETFLLSRSSNTILALSDHRKTIDATASFTQTLTAAATLGDGWEVDYRVESGIQIVFDPNSTETIDGATTKTVIGPAGGRIRCNGSAFFTTGFATQRNGINPKGHLFGLTMSRNATATKLDVAAGTCRDSTDAVDISLAAAITAGAIVTPFAAGSTQNKLDTGTVANSTWYHVYAIRKDADGSGDFLFSLSASAPSMPSGYTFFRRIGAIKTDGSANVTAFTQDGDLFQWSVPLNDINAANPGSAAVTRTLTVPTGVNVIWVGGALVQSATVANYNVLVTDLATTDTAPTTGIQNLSLEAQGSQLANGGALQVRTNTSAQVRTRLSNSDAGTTFTMTTIGWLDRRGRDS